jgi:hypothetical protein
MLFAKRTISGTLDFFHHQDPISATKNRKTKTNQQDPQTLPLPDSSAATSDNLSVPFVERKRTRRTRLLPKILN